MIGTLGLLSIIGELSSEDNAKSSAISLSLAFACRLILVSPLQTAMVGCEKELFGGLTNGNKNVYQEDTFFDEEEDLLR